MRDVDEEFLKYLDSEDYDRAEGSLMDIIRAAYKAGFEAGQKPDRPPDRPPDQPSDQPPDNIVHLFAF